MYPFEELAFEHMRELQREFERSRAMADALVKLVRAPYDGALVALALPGDSGRAFKQGVQADE